MPGCGIDRVIATALAEAKAAVIATAPADPQEGPALAAALRAEKGVDAYFDPADPS